MFTDAENNSVHFPLSVPEVPIVFGLCILEEPVACTFRQVIVFPQPTLLSQQSPYPVSRYFVTIQFRYVCAVSAFCYCCDAMFNARNVNSI